MRAIHSAVFRASVRPQLAQAAVRFASTGVAHKAGASLGWGLRLARTVAPSLRKRPTDRVLLHGTTAFPAVLLPRGLAALGAHDLDVCAWDPTGGVLLADVREERERRRQDPKGPCTRDCDYWGWLPPDRGPLPGRQQLLVGLPTLDGSGRTAGVDVRGGSRPAHGSVNSEDFLRSDTRRMHQWQR